jgi:hypothetical protein
MKYPYISIHVHGRVRTSRLSVSVHQTVHRYVMLDRNPCNIHRFQQVRSHLRTQFLVVYDLVR